MMLFLTKKKLEKLGINLDMNNVYRKYLIGGEHFFRFNDPVQATMIFSKDEDRIGRLVQVRKNAGAFGSDMYLIRRVNGKLIRIENAGLAPYTEKELPFFEGDSEEQEYTLGDSESPETGFIIENASPSVDGFMVEY